MTLKTFDFDSMSFALNSSWPLIVIYIWCSVALSPLSVLFNLICLILRMISTTSSTTPGIEENS